MSTSTIHVGDCRDVLATLPDASIDSIVTDPPYELGFMGKAWDATGIANNVDMWRECLRVLKPGGHLLAFSGSRTYHRMACAIEDAGFEIRDQIMWVYGSGFPKSLDVSKAIDKRGGAVADFAIFRDAVKEAMERNGVTRAQVADALGNHMLSHYLTAGSQPAVPNARDYTIIRDTVALGSDFDHLFLPAAERPILSERTFTRNTQSWETSSGMLAIGDKQIRETAPATPEAEQWSGWGTALKPAHEPIVLARKPLVGTVAANVLQHGTGALNIDDCRIEAEVRPLIEKMPQTADGTWNSGSFAHSGTSVGTTTVGRWPANFIHDGSDEVTDLFPDTKSGMAIRSKSGGNTFGCETPKPIMDDLGYGDSGSAARFFYCAKASKADRNEGLDEILNHHPTVKPTDLMRYLCRLITPPNGIVLDPFAGSGSTGKAAILERFSFIGIEQDPDYAAIANARIKHALNSREETLFDD